MFPKSLGAYDDIRRVFDLALVNGGIKRRCPDSPNTKLGSGAIQWRHRANYFRKKLLDSSTAPDGVPVTTPYDVLILKIPKEDPTLVLIELRNDIGHIERLDGGVLLQPDADPIHGDVQDLAKELGLDL